MIYGIGIDIVKVARLDNTINKLGEKFLQKVFLPEEVSYCQSKPYPAIHFAARFAAKEALSKAIKTGFTQGVCPKQIEIVKAKNGNVSLKLHGITKKICAELAIKHLHLSISHEKEMAIAQVLAEI